MSIFNFPTTVLDPARIIKDVDAAFADVHAQLAALRKKDDLEKTVADLEKRVKVLEQAKPPKP